MSTRSTICIATVASALLLLAGCESSTKASGGKTSSKDDGGDGYLPARCVTFDPLAAGTTYGPPAHHPGSQIFSENGIDVSVHRIDFVGGKSGFVLARVEASVPLGFGQGNVLRLNNVTAEFDFNANNVDQVSLNYRDLGGTENLWVNGQRVHVGDLPGATTSPHLPAGITVNVQTKSVPGGVDGTLLVSGRLNSIRIGGQEFWIDNLCARARGLGKGD